MTQENGTQNIKFWPFFRKNVSIFLPKNSHFREKPTLLPLICHAEQTEYQQRATVVAVVEVFFEIS